MPIPALIEHRGAIHFSLISKDGFDLICPLTSNVVTPIDKPTTTLSDKALRRLSAEADKYILHVVGAGVERVLRTTGQWDDVLTFMAAQMEYSIATMTPRLKKKREKFEAMPKPVWLSS